MKSRLLILIITLLLIPINVKANIICNDGTRSPSCSDCHRGCCSSHGGCTNTPNYGDSSSTSSPSSTTTSSYSSPSSSSTS